MGYRASAQNQVVLTDSLNPLPPHLVKNKRKRTFCAIKNHNSKNLYETRSQA